MRFPWVFAVSALALAACQASQTNDTNAAANSETSAQPAAPAAPTGPAAPVAPVNDSAPSAPAAPVAPLPPPLNEPHGPIDPKSAEAAGQVVQSYGALIEQGRWSEARTLWRDPAAADAFRTQLKAFTEVHQNIGDLGPIEGAAGSLYITEPVTFYGKTSAGKALERKAVATLRRVNDVDGSTAEQRRWHIERIEWK